MARILVVDDSRTMLAATKKILEAGGHQVIVAETGEEGVEKAGSEQPEVIFMDLIMPGISGFEATRKITTDPETSNIPVVILTTKEQETDKVWAKRQGAVDFIVKPPGPTLLHIVDSLLD